MGARRVVITGIGVICALGKKREQFWEALAAGRCGLAPIELVDTSQLRFQHGGEVKGFRAEEYFDAKTADLVDRFTHFAVIAAREAIAEAGIVWSAELRQRCVIATGSCVGGQTSEDASFEDVYRRGRNRVHPMTIPRAMANGGASMISLEHGIVGPTWTVSTACSSANHAIGQAFWMVRYGLAEMALAGGSEAPFSFGLLKAWEALRVVSPDVCRPFSRDRQGMTLGEGGAMLVLEPLEAARARGARVYAEIAGFGMSSDAHHITQPSVEGPARAMRLALEDAGMAPEEVDYINAHGTGTQANDPIETAAIRRVFGAHADKLAVSSTKSLHGHALGAAGAIEGAATALAIHHSVAPPTANFTAPDPECDLDVIPHQARAMSIGAALSNSFAFGGLNAVLAFRRVEE